MNKQIIIDNEEIINFFNNNPFVDPTQYILWCINKFGNNVVEHKNINIKENVCVLNEEFLKFVSQKENLVNNLLNNIKEQKKIIENMKFNKLEELLKEHIDDNKIDGILCPNCKIKKFPNKKSLSAHLRGCKKQNNETFDKEEEEEDN
jgi:hypothetical protein